MPLAATLLMLAGCAEEAITPNNSNSNEQEPDTKGLTEFVVADNATRTTAEYFNKGGTNRGLHFYWTENDRLWVNTGTALAPVLTQDRYNNINSQLVSNPTIPTAVKRAVAAKFWFDGTFTENNYYVRYTGKNNLVGDKITIKAQQTQTVPNDLSHIAEAGDCGTAKAKKEGGRYNFAIDHKAAYLTFLPYTTQTVLSNGAKLIKIRVLANQAIAGEFKFTDDGIDQASRPAPAETNQSITLTLGNGATTGFTLSNKPKISDHAATMVAAPGTYASLAVEYIFYLSSINKTGSITKTYSNVTLLPGKNKLVSASLQIKTYPALYYRWDATAPYPAGSNQTHHPAQAVNSCKNCPNVNVFYWYAAYGDPHWDNDEMWILNGQIYTGGVWIKRLAAIPGRTDRSPNGRDYRTDSFFAPSITTTGNIGKPKNLSSYFYLPAMGSIRWDNNPTNQISGQGYSGFYWSSSPSPYINNWPMFENNGAYYLTFYKDYMDRVSMTFQTDDIRLPGGAIFPGEQ